MKRNITRKQKRVMCSLFTKAGINYIPFKMISNILETLVLEWDDISKKEAKIVISNLRFLKIVSQ